jgi:hypothetical protein
MPLQNRVDPFGQIHAVPDRGLFMGNRGGCFHRPDRTLKPRHWASRQWIICRLEFKGRKRPLMQPGLYTELFFLDEVTALAAGHRPCFECRRDTAKAFRGALALPGPVRVADLDARIAGEVQSVLKGQSVREKLDPASLPDGAFFASGGTAFLKLGQTGRPWSFSGYGAPTPLPQRATRLTPQATCAALAAGYRPLLHATAA